MVHTLYPAKVRLNEEVHKYYDAMDREYVSFSRLFSFLSPKFDSEKIASVVARSRGVSSEDVRGEWNNATNEGTRIDNALTLYAMTGQILDTDRDIEKLIKGVLVKYKYYNKTYEQLVVYNEEFRTAGSLDKLSLVTNRKDSDFIISDFKVFAKGMDYEYKGQKWLNAPFDYMLNSKYNKISFQLSYYAYHFELLTGRKCQRLFIDLITPVK